MGCKPNHPFMLGWLQTMVTNIRNHPDLEYTSRDVVTISGPVGLRNYYDSLDKNHNNAPVLSRSCQVIPYVDQWTLSPICQVEDDIYVYNLWAEGSGWNDPEKIWWLFGLCLVILVIIVIYLFRFKQ
jgi:hypothetical protein